MPDNKTLWDADGPHTHSREFSVGDMEFRLLIAEDYRSYTLFVTHPDGEMESIPSLRGEVIDWSAERVFEVFTRGELQRYTV